MSRINNPLRSKSVLISGASIAGPALAYWLSQYGFDVTVVERASTIRTGGYPIDIRGAAIDIVDKMGLLPQLRAAHIHMREMSFVDDKGDIIGSIPVYETIGSDASRDIELPRGTLTQFLYEKSADSSVTYRFGDSIRELHNDDTGVDIFFTSGRQEHFDIVVGADGTHSNTRSLVFGPEEKFTHDLGFRFNLFSLSNDENLSHCGIVYAQPGKIAGLWAVEDAPRLFGFMAFAPTDKMRFSRLDRSAQIQLTHEIYDGVGWKVPKLLKALEKSDDLFFDSVAQIRMPQWTSGCVALIGDAAFAPSFRSGQGTSLALVAAYVLAGEIARHETTQRAFDAYETLMRPYVEANQALATDGNSAFFLPRTQSDIDARNKTLAEIKAHGMKPIFDSRKQAVYEAISLPDYKTLVRTV